jgi:hypothetical protein
MKSNKPYPLIADVKVQPNQRLLVWFRNGVKKLYDCTPILALPAFEPLRRDEALFQRARADKHGYAVIWNDEFDLAESEIWLGGRLVRETRSVDGITKGMKAAGTAKKKSKRPAVMKTGRKKPSA